MKCVYSKATIHNPIQNNNNHKHNNNNHNNNNNNNTTNNSNLLFFKHPNLIGRQCAGGSCTWPIYIYFISFGRHPYPEILTFTSPEHLRIKSLAQWPSSGSAVIWTHGHLIMTYSLSYIGLNLHFALDVILYCLNVKTEILHNIKHFPVFLCSRVESIHY